MFNSKCCVCGTVRNCGPYLEKVLQNIEKIGSQFSDYKIVIAYDESNDNSLEILNNYKTNNPNNFILHIGNQPLHKYRVYNIANARNKCLETLRIYFHDYEYFIMMDCDDVCSNPINLENLIYYLINNEDWDGLTFNKKPYYDLWALSKYPYSFGCFHFKDWQAWGRNIEQIIEQTPPKTLIPCLSAFNGFGIYKTNKFVNCFYDPKPRLDLLPEHLIKENIRIAGNLIYIGKASEVDCEHRSFHLMAKNYNDAKLRIAPEIIF